MHTAIVDWFGYNLSPMERLSLIRDAGFDAVLLLWTDAFDPDYAAFPTYAKTLGLKIESVHAPYQNANAIWKDNLDGTAYTEQILSCIRDCHIHGIPTLVMHPTSGKPNLSPDVLAPGIDRFKRIGEFAEQMGINVALENMEDPAVLQCIFPVVDTGRLGFCFDSGHWNAYTPELDLLTMYGDRLLTLHLHDNDGEEDQHALPGTGTIVWKSLMEKLDRLGYEGALSLEVRSTGYADNADPSAFLQLAMEKATTLTNWIL